MPHESEERAEDEPAARVESPHAPVAATAAPSRRKRGGTLAAAAVGMVLGIGGTYLVDRCQTGYLGTIQSARPRVPATAPSMGGIGGERERAAQVLPTGRTASFSLGAATPAQRTRPGRSRPGTQPDSAPRATSDLRVAAGGPERASASEAALPEDTPTVVSDPPPFGPEAPVDAPARPAPRGRPEPGPPPPPATAGGAGEPGGDSPTGTDAPVAGSPAGSAASTAVAEPEAPTAVTPQEEPVSIGNVTGLAPRGETGGLREPNESTLHGVPAPPMDIAEPRAPTRRDAVAPPDPGPGSPSPAKTDIAAAQPQHHTWWSEADPAVQRFLDDWARAIEEGDYTLFHALGFPGSRKEFSRQFGRDRDRKVRFGEIAALPLPDGTLQVHMKMIYSFRDRLGARTVESVEKLVLHEREGRLRNATGSTD